MPPTITGWVHEKWQVRRLRKEARAVVRLGRPFQGADASFAELALLRALTLERELRVASLFRSRESVAAMSRGVVESVLRGLYILIDPDSGRGRLEVEAQGHLGKMSVFGDESLGRILREAAASRTDNFQRGMPDLRQVAVAVDEHHQFEAVPGHGLGRYLYHDWYLPLSNLSVHPSGSALSRYYRIRTRIIRRRPWGFVPRRGAIRMADGSIAYLVIALRDSTGADTTWLRRYASRQLVSANVPLVILGVRIALGIGPAVLTRAALAVFRHRGALGDDAPRPTRLGAVRAILRAVDPEATEEELDRLADSFLDEVAARNDQTQL